nr:hypothetical protein B0A51_10600 [Rachicladosporium sp. CCFEE 5018]
MAHPRLITVEEIKKHNTIEACWLVINDEVWDLSEFAPDHPGGGEIIYKHAGRDASSSYNGIHAQSVLSSNLDSSKLIGALDKRSVTDEWSKPPPSATPELQLHDKPPLETIINSQDFEDVAQRTVTKKTWAFYSSADTDCLTRDRNREFFGRIWFRPRLLRDVKKVDTSTTILGHAAGAPFFVSPAAMAKLVHPDGERAMARGCVPNCIPQGISSNASFPIEEIVNAVPKDKNHPFFFQLYVNKDRSKSEALLKHVRGLGVDVCFATIDAPQAGKREADERVKADEGVAAPMSGAKASNDKKGGGMGRLMGGYIDPSFVWADMTWLRRHWPGKIVVKGVQSWQDAKMAADLGIHVLLSNHGGRNLDTSPPAIMTLLECQMNCPEIFSQIEVLVDGGIRRGSDILKCLCLGATAVGLGRPFLYATNYGQEGVEHLVEILKSELETAMALVGVTSIDQCQPGLLARLPYQIETLLTCTNTWVQDSQGCNDSDMKSPA